MTDKDNPITLFEDDTHDWAAQALRDGLRQQAEAVTFEPLEPRLFMTRPADFEDAGNGTTTSIHAASGHDAPAAPHRRRWTVGIAGLAAAAAVAAIAVPLISTSTMSPVAPGPLRAVPQNAPSTAPDTTSNPATPLEPGVWTATSTPPIEPRRDAIVTWADGSFFVIGGTASKPCPMDADPATCEDIATLSDGARYDPTTDTWTRIADAPIPVSHLGGQSNPWGISWAAIGRTLYLYAPTGAYEFGDLLAYNMDTNTWMTLPGPNAGVTPCTDCQGSTPNAPLPAGRLATDGTTLFSLPDVETSSSQDNDWATFDPATNTWAKHDYPLEPPATGGPTFAKAILGDKMIAVYLAEDPTDSRVGLINPLTGAGQVRGGVPVPPQRAIPITLGDYAVWDGDDKRAWFYHDGKWSSVALPTDDGPFVGSMLGMTLPWYVTTDTMVALRGYLYDPAARAWAPTPKLPGPSTEPVIAGGGNFILDCFGYTNGKAKPTYLTGSYATGCHVLAPKAATLSSPHD